MKAHVNQICLASYIHISNIWFSAIRRMLTNEAAETLVHAFVSSRLDYCNSLLCGLPASTLNKLQLIQNHAARVVTGARKYDRITPVLRKLQWLPMSQRIIFKLHTLTYQAVHGQAPVYLCELAVRYRPGRTLRSADDPTRLLNHELAASTGIAVLPLPVPPCGMICLAVWGRRSQCTLSRGS